MKKYEIVFKTTIKNFEVITIEAESKEEAKETFNNDPFKIIENNSDIDLEGESVEIELDHIKELEAK